MPSRHSCSAKDGRQPATVTFAAEHSMTCPACCNSSGPVRVTNSDRCARRSGRHCYCQRTCWASPTNGGEGQKEKNASIWTPRRTELSRPNSCHRQWQRQRQRRPCPFSGVSRQEIRWRSSPPSRWRRRPRCRGTSPCFRSNGFARFPRVAMRLHRPNNAQ